ncbi:hypothetical protein SAMN02745165_01186 [Malonomonas rubra DSM 5091]|uniref:PHD-type domain-containing protein n=1 Tax=Malonomonas rubra DSM 5091 TaxID=1122189 RepID=A0A1M6F806_MALRU|nr:hypothetical protein [Malonomonas rubra]SHI93847.1 hypothetical protein SAMN02745165_01186 [Malonomonas rubra DSM 5091]
MSNEEKETRWMCHICDYSSNVGEGIACSECYKITCRQHLTTTMDLNPESGLYEFRQVCVACQLKDQI